MKILDLDSPVMIFLSRFADLIILNLLWLICCLPVFTIGASTTAMYHVCRHMEEDHHISVFRDFFSNFRTDFRQSTPVFLILLVPSVAIVLTFLMLTRTDAGMPLLHGVLMLVSSIVLAMVSAFVYPLASIFDTKPLGLIKNALLLSFGNLPRALPAVILNLSPILVLFISLELFLRLSIFWLAIGFALVAYLNMRLLMPVFKKLMPPEETDEPAEDAAEADLPYDGEL